MIVGLLNDITLVGFMFTIDSLRMREPTYDLPRLPERKIIDEKMGVVWAYVSGRLKKFPLPDYQSEVWKVIADRPQRNLTRYLVVGARYLAERQCRKPLNLPLIVQIALTK